MKILGTLMIAGVAIVGTAFTVTKNVSTSTEISVKKPATYMINKEKSSLEWKGGKSEEYFHTGTVSFSEGSLAMDKDEVISGKFVVDMSTIKVGDDMPEGKINYLTGHLKNEDFFNVTKFPTVTVTVNGYEDGLLLTSLNVLGFTLENKVPVELVNSKSEITINGEFDIDFDALNMPGMRPNPESGEVISSVISYKLNLVMSK